ncbi:hypothetical protein IWW52_001631, partial [Coemansia sp. RSA 2704]
PRAAGTGDRGLCVRRQRAGAPDGQDWPGLQDRAERDHWAKRGCRQRRVSAALRADGGRAHQGLRVGQEQHCWLALERWPLVAAGRRHCAGRRRARAGRGLRQWRVGSAAQVHQLQRLRARHCHV